MLNKLGQISLRNKIVAMVIAPVIGLLFFALGMLVEKFEQYYQMNKVDNYTHYIIKSSQLVHELQKERGASAGYLGSSGKKFANKLKSQRELTDTKLKSYLEFAKDFDISDFSKNIQDSYQNVNSNLKNISTMRSNIDSMKITTKEALRYYTNINQSIIGSITELNLLSSDREVSNLATATYNLLSAKENAGIERAVLSNVFSKGYFTTELYNKFLDLVSAQSIHLKAYNVAITDREKEQEIYKKYMTNELISKVKYYRGIALSKREKNDILSKIKSELGYGGIIHVFKNYLLRGHLKYINTFDVKFANFEKLIADYRALAHVSAPEKERILIIENTFKAYRDNFLFSIDNRDKGDSIAMLDKKIKISDGPAVKALDELTNKMLGVEAEEWFDIATKRINALKSVENELLKSLESEVESVKNMALLSFSIFLAIIIIVLLVTAISIIKTISKVVDSVNVLKDRTIEIRKSSDELSYSSSTLSEMANDQAASIEQISATLEESTNQVSANTIHTNEASVLSDETNDLANVGHRDIKGLLDSMQRISDSSAKISHIIKAIDEIAFQTNLLALNAAVEAARAGEHGLGFAVVAEEVRALAGKSAEAAKETSMIIEESQKEVDTGKNVASKTNESFTNILDKINKTNELIKDIAIASRDQSEGIKQINDAILTVDKATQKVAMSSEDFKLSASELEQIAKEAFDNLEIVADLIGLDVHDVRG
jgi:methyl-accepting chemotaxis protein